jgi:hypothetical protein
VEPLAPRAGEGGGRDREEDQGRAHRAHGSEVVHPLPHSQSQQIERGEAPEERHRKREHEQPVVGEVYGVAPPHVDGDPDKIEEKRRDIEDVVGPVAPAADEAVGVAEELPRPEVDPPFLGIPGRELRYRDALREEEQQERPDPESDRRKSSRRSDRDQVEVQYGDDVEEDEIPESQGARKLGMRRLAAFVGGVHRGGFYTVTPGNGYERRVAPGA